MARAWALGTERTAAAKLLWPMGKYSARSRPFDRPLSDSAMRDIEHTRLNRAPFCLDVRRTSGAHRLPWRRGMTSRVVCRIIWVGALAAVAGLARAGAQDVPQRFRGGTDLVALDVCVKDAAGRFLPGLAADDFLVLEDNKPQEVSLLAAAGAVPLTVSLLVDRSASMRRQARTRR